MIGIIGGTGLYNVDFFGEAEQVQVTTQFGRVDFWKGHQGNQDILFLPRHGANHERLAYEVQHKANIMAFYKMGVTRILATVAAGGINPAYGVGNMVLLDQFISFHTTMYTYGKYSVDMTEPYCPELRVLLKKTAKSLGYPLHESGTYISFDGPRYETAAEIRAFQMMGSDMVGMTNGAEAALARELGICYSTIALITNRAAGLSSQGPDLKQHSTVSKENSGKILHIFSEVAQAITSDQSCSCHQHLEKALQARKFSSVESAFNL